MDDKQRYGLLTTAWTYLHVPNCFKSQESDCFCAEIKNNNKTLSAWAIVASDPCRDGCLFLQVLSVQFD